MCTLDLSKVLMYDFHYNYIEKRYKDKGKLLFTDTVSLTYEIETDDVYQDFWKDKNCLTTVITQKILLSLMKRTKK